MTVVFDTKRETKKQFPYPYIPNSVPEVKSEMLKDVGLTSVEEIYAEIPERLRFKGTQCTGAYCIGMRTAQARRRAPSEE